MEISILRSCCDNKQEVTYNIEKKDTLLEAFFHIKETLDATFSFRSGCRSGVCGSCAVVVDGIERLSCKTKPKDKQKITPLKNSKVIKDLVVELSFIEEKLKKANLSFEEEAKITEDDIKKIKKETECILCSSCYSSCPVYSVKDFLGPFALNRVYRYSEDKRSNLDLQNFKTDIFDCTLCGNCSLVCPMGIDIKNNIYKMQLKLGLNNNSFDFGFNPNF